MTAHSVGALRFWLLECCCEDANVLPPSHAGVELCLLGRQEIPSKEDSNRAVHKVYHHSLHEEPRPPSHMRQCRVSVEGQFSTFHVYVKPR